MSKIKRIDRVETGRYTFGTNFKKGDYIPTIVSFIVHVFGEAPFEVERGEILKHFPGRKRVTQSMRDSFKGKDSSIFKKK